MMMSSHSEGDSTERTTTSLFYDRAQGSAYMVFINGAEHPNFGDVSLFAGLLKATGDLGPISGARCVEIQDVYILAFFDRHLKGKDSALLNGPSSDYPEVVLKSHHP
jgi:hypothetical protein